MDLYVLQGFPSLLGIPDVDKLLHRLLLVTGHLFGHGSARKKFYAAESGRIPACQAATHLSRIVQQLLIGEI
jgi:hypothetical protein